MSKIWLDGIYIKMQKRPFIPISFDKLLWNIIRISLWAESSNKRFCKNQISHKWFPKFKLFDWVILAKLVNSYLNGKSVMGN